MPPPSFGSQDYWNQRFTSNSNPFEWLEAPTALDSYLVDALKQCSDPDRQVLHIGCGTSLLSFHLRAHVEKPEQIHNLDYSDVAIEVGKKREADIFKLDDAAMKDDTQNHTECLNEKGVSPIQSTCLVEEKEPEVVTVTDIMPAPSYMRWSSVNLLDHKSLREVCEPSTYSVIVDKSTSDSIACAEDLYVPLPYHIVTSNSSTTTQSESSEPLHPLHIMAVHLALITKPRARWISLSYSMDRLPFLVSDTADGSSEPTENILAGSDLSQPDGHVTEEDRDTDLDDDISLDDDLDDIP